MIVARKNAKTRTEKTSSFSLTPAGNTEWVPNSGRKSPPENLLEPSAALFKNVIAGANNNKKRSGNKCRFCNENMGHAINRCPLRDQCQLKGMDYNLSNKKEVQSIIRNIKTGMIVSGHIDPMSTSHQCYSDVPPK